jgi:hypothetical protein
VRAAARSERGMLVGQGAGRTRRRCWRAPPITITPLSPAAALACSSALSIPSVTNVWTPHFRDCLGSVMSDHEGGDAYRTGGAAGIPPWQRVVVVASTGDHG